MSGRRAGSRSNAQEGAVQLTSNRQRRDSKSSLCSSVGGATRGRASVEIFQPDSSANQKSVRMPVKNQIKFLNLVAKELPDPFLGIHLAESIELREMGFVYYVIASSETLGDALRRLARYSGITNEGIRIACQEGKD